MQEVANDPVYAYHNNHRYLPIINYSNYLPIEEKDDYSENIAQSKVRERSRLNYSSDQNYTSGKSTATSCGKTTVASYLKQNNESLDIK